MAKRLRPSPCIYKTWTAGKRYCRSCKSRISAAKIHLCLKQPPVCSAMQLPHQYASQLSGRWGSTSPAGKTFLFCPHTAKCVCAKVSFGESHKVVGGHPALGNWDVTSAPQMQWNDGNVWTLEVQLEEGSDVEFKVNEGGIAFSLTVIETHPLTPCFVAVCEGS